MTIGDDELRAHFDDLRAEDDAAAPAFDPPRPVTVPRRLRRSVWLGAAAMIAVAAGLVALRARAHRKPVTVQIDPSVLTWTSPTDGLLQAARQLTSTSGGGL